MELRWHESLSGALADDWDQTWTDLDLHPFQHRAVAAARARVHGQILRYVTGHDAGRLVFGAAIQVRSTRPWPVRLAVTRGPWAPDQAALLSGIQALTVTSPPGFGRPMSLRLDPHLPLPAEAVEAGLSAMGFHGVAAEFHQRTMRVSLAPEESVLWANCRSTTRQMIRKADASGLVTRIGEAADIQAYWTLHREAASLKVYGLPALAWLESLQASGQGVVAVTESDGRIVGGAVLARGGRSLHYLYGAKAPDYKGPASYQTMWQVLKWARAYGLSWLDLGGLPDDDDGIAFFKRAFGGEDLRFTAERERILMPRRHAVWGRARQWLSRRSGGK